MSNLTNVYHMLIDVLDAEESKSNATKSNETCLQETEEICKSLDVRILQLQSEKREQYEKCESVYSKCSSWSRSSRKSGKSSHYSKQRLKNGAQYRKDYVDFMQENSKNGFAEKVPKEEVLDETMCVWYIPSHGVYHKKKSSKIGVVFDCNALYHGFSLNQQLLQGPHLTNNLTGVLCWFQMERIAFMCNIKAKFHQVKVNAINCNYLWFLWWEDENFDSNPVEYWMTVHLFVATSSPECANFALKTTASQRLKSVSSVKQAKSLVSSTKSLCQKEGFHVHKFNSNNSEVLNSVPPEDRATDKRNPSLVSNDPAVEHALGVHWCMETAALQFRIELKDAFIETFLEFPWRLSCFLNLLYNSSQWERFIKD